jgi:tetrahydromethanopterin S-methyltransferase subunit G
MTTQELYELLSKQLTEMDARFTRQFESLDTRLESLDARLRNVEVDVAEIKGRKAGWESARNWIATGVALVALGVAIAVALWK